MFKSDHIRGVSLRSSNRRRKNLLRMLRVMAKSDPMLAESSPPGKRTAGRDGSARRCRQFTGHSHPPHFGSPSRIHPEQTGCFSARTGWSTSVSPANCARGRPRFFPEEHKACLGWTPSSWAKELPGKSVLPTDPRRGYRPLNTAPST